MVLRGDETAGKYMAFWLQRDRVAAAMAVNTWGQMEAVEALVRGGATVPAAVLADPDVPLDSLAG